MDSKVKELAQQVDENKAGITPDQLRALIEADAQPAAQPTNQPPVEPATAPTPTAPAVQPAQPAVPAPGEPNVLDIIPEKFRAKDVPTSLKNITKSYSELEEELRKQKDEVANLNKLVTTFIEKEPSYTPAPVAQPQPEMIDDSQFFEKPTESVKKIAAQMAASQIIAYHVAQERQRFVMDFKTKHPDFENYRDDIMAVLRTRPDLDKDERNLPMVYELGKQRYNARMEAMRRDLGILPTQTNTNPAPQNVDIEAITKAAYEKAKNDILTGITQRTQASGIQGSGPATSPEVRVQPRVAEQQLSEEEKVIQAMLNSGPKKLTLGE